MNTFDNFIRRLGINLGILTESGIVNFQNLIKLKGAIRMENSTLVVDFQKLSEILKEFGINLEGRTINEIKKAIVKALKDTRLSQLIKKIEINIEEKKITYWKNEEERKKYIESTKNIVKNRLIHNEEEQNEKVQDKKATKALSLTKTFEQAHLDAQDKEIIKIPSGKKEKQEEDIDTSLDNKLKNAQRKTEKTAIERALMAAALIEDNKTEDTSLGFE